MMIQRITINPTVLADYIQASNISIEDLAEKVPKIYEVINGKRLPTFNQLSQVAKQLHIPVGLLLMDDIVGSTEDVVADFRTIDSTQIEEMSAELRDTIKEMKEKQSFLRGEVEHERFFVGMFSIENDKASIISQALQILGKGITKNRFYTYREKLSKSGVFTFLNGKVKDNTHRPLNLKEFRGFVLVDKKAPIIFINQQDSKTGQLFTLIHEFIHLLLGESNLLKVLYSEKSGKIEKVVNQITAEILAPKKYILMNYNHSSSVIDNIYNLSKSLEVSREMMTRRLLELNIITQDDYQRIVRALKETYSNPNERSSGGNYYHNINFRIDRTFFEYVNNAVMQDKMTYTEAFNTVGVGYKGYQALLGEQSSPF